MSVHVVPGPVVCPDCDEPRYACACPADSDRCADPDCCEREPVRQPGTPDELELMEIL